jgi:hypothetical protein
MKIYLIIVGNKLLLISSIFYAVRLKENSINLYNFIIYYLKFFFFFFLMNENFINQIQATNHYSSFKEIVCMESLS